FPPAASSSRLESRRGLLRFSLLGGRWRSAVGALAVCPRWASDGCARPVREQLCVVRDDARPQRCWCIGRLDAECRITLRLTRDRYPPPEHPGRRRGCGRLTRERAAPILELHSFHAPTLESDTEV